MSLSPDGNRAYVADPLSGELAILDTSRDPGARARTRRCARSAASRGSARRSRRTPSRSPAAAGRTCSRPTSTTPASAAAAAATTSAPRGSSTSRTRRARAWSPNLRLAVNQPAEHAEAEGDPGAFSPVQGYAAHYCDVSTPRDPTVVACSFIASGLRVFDISRLDQAARDRLPRRAHQARRRERDARELVRHVQADRRARAARGLVLRRRDGPPRPARRAGRVARRDQHARKRPCVRKRRFVARVRLPKGVKAAHRPRALRRAQGQAGQARRPAASGSRSACAARAARRR